MISFARTDTSTLSLWWWTVDRWMLAGIACLVAAGLILGLAASPAVAERLGLESYHFIWRQIIFIPLAVVVLLSASMLTPLQVRRLSVALFILFLGLLAATLLVGPEIKGARRWLLLGPFTVQPVEFLKPVFVVVSAWMLSLPVQNSEFPGRKISCLLMLVVALLVVAQPDFGQTMLIIMVWFSQIFMAGLSIAGIVAVVVSAILIGVVAYLTLPHVSNRIDSFLDPSSGDTYQIDTAINAFRNGGLFGRGPGEGIVKQVLPDAHTDFVFAVAGEEFGVILCLMMVVLFTLVVIRGLICTARAQDPFVSLAGGGLLVLFGLQAVINMAVNLNLLPNKGMTLPFISYGGSSLLSLALAMGMVLALLRNVAQQVPARRAR